MQRKSLAFLIALVAILAVPFAAMAEPQAVLRWSDIPPNSMTGDGLAKVIVQVHVPDLAKLTAASASMHPPRDDDNADAARSSMAAADSALTEAISAAVSPVLSRLPAKAYRLNRTYRFLPFLAIEVTPDALLLLQADPRVVAVHPDIPRPLPEYGPTLEAPAGKPESNASTSTSSSPDPAVPSMDDTISLIAADKAWAKGYSGSGWYVAILDTGIRRTHQFFQGKTIVEACFSSAGHCPNGQTSMTGTGAAAHYSSSYAGYDHGTHVAGTAAGKRADGSLYGVAKDADIIAINVFSRFTAAECGGSPCVMSYDSDQIYGLEYVYGLRGSYNIGAGNMSLGGGKYSAYCDNASQKSAIDLLRAANIPTAIATGNEYYCGYIGSPACISTAIAVMASTKGDQETDFNNWHPTMGDLFAPGASILSATGDSDTSYARWNGTSMATPHMTGALTLSRQYQSSDGPDAHLARLTQLGPSITTLCAGGGSRPRLYVDNFSGSATGDWKTEIGIVSMASAATSGVLRGFNSAGSQVWSQNVTLPTLGRTSLDVTQAAGSAASLIKYMRLDISSGAAVGYQKFYQSGKYRVGLEALPQPNQSGLYLPHIHSDSNWWTGVGIVNTTSSAKSLGFSFSNGVQAAKVIGSGAHDAFLISDLLGAGAFQGSAAVSNGAGIVGLQLFGSDRQLSGVSLSDNTANHLYFPHVDQNSPWWTGIGVYNPSTSTTTLTVKAYDNNGNLIQSWDNYMQLPPNHRLVGETAMPTGTAWFSVDALPEPVLGFELFGVTTQDRLAGFNVVDLETTQGVFPKIETSGWTGISFVNVGAETATIQLQAMSDSGAVVASRSLSLGANAHTVGLIENLFPGQNIASATYVRFTSDQNIVGFQLNGSTDDTMLDAIPALGSAANYGTSTLYFPHIAAE